MNIKSTILYGHIKIEQKFFPDPNQKNGIVCCGRKVEYDNKGNLINTSPWEKYSSLK